MGLHGAPFISILCIEIIPALWHHWGSLGPGQDRQVKLSMFLLPVETLDRFEFIGWEQCQELAFVSTETAERLMSRD